MNHRPASRSRRDRIARVLAQGATAAAFALAGGAATTIPASAEDRSAQLTAASADGSAAKPLAARLTRRTQLRSRPGGPVVTTLDTFTEYGSRRALAVVARRGDWLGVLSESMPNSRAGWIPAANAELHEKRYRLDVDRSARLLTVLLDGRVVRRMRVAVGRSATSTPTGRFAVTDALRVVGAPGAYGCCALPITGHQPSVPSDRNRLAIHGTNAEGTIGSAASSGCLRGRRADMHWLVVRITPGTPLQIRA